MPSRHPDRTTGSLFSESDFENTSKPEPHTKTLFETICDYIGGIIAWAFYIAIYGSLTLGAFSIISSLFSGVWIYALVLAGGALLKWRADAWRGKGNGYGYWASALLIAGVCGAAYPYAEPLISSQRSGSHSYGATAVCSDGTYSYAAHHRGACSHHGGVAEWER